MADIQYDNSARTTATSESEGRLMNSMLKGKKKRKKNELLKKMVKSYKGKGGCGPKRKY